MSNWSKILLEHLKKNYEETNKKIEDIKEITLDGHYIGSISSEIKRYLEKFIGAEKLNMSFCKLHSLENLPNLPSLTKIELNDNLLDETEFIKLQKYPLLSEICFVNNKVKSYEPMKEMNKMRDINLIDLTENPVCKIKDYRKNLFEIFPKLIFLDRLGKNNESYEEFEDNEDDDEEEEQEENDDDIKFLDDRPVNNEPEEEEEEEEEEDSDDNNDENDLNQINNEEVNEEEEEEIENPHLGKRKKYK